MRKSNKMTVLGGGLWGTVLAQHLSRGGSQPVTLWEFFPEAASGLARSRRHPHIPGFRLHENVAVTHELGAAVRDADVLIFVLPSGVVRATARAAAKQLRKRPVVVNASKGLEAGSLKTMGEVLGEELRSARAVYTLTGPSFAREVARGVPTKLLLGGPAGPAAERVRRLFDGGVLSVSFVRDRKGIELGGSLKNVLAIGAGILDGLGAGANTKAALIVQGLQEMGRLAESCGGRAETLVGLAGLGDLIATGTSSESRNRAFGEKVGAGMTPRRALKEIPTVVEGVEAAHGAAGLARRYRVKAPLLTAVWQVVHQGRQPRMLLKSMGF